MIIRVSDPFNKPNIQHSTAQNIYLYRLKNHENPQLYNIPISNKFKSLYRRGSKASYTLLLLILNGTSREEIWTGRSCKAGALLSR